MVGAVNEEILWKGGPSQLLNLGKFVAAGLMAVGIGVLAVFTSPLVWVALVLPLAWAIWCFLQIRCRRFELTTQRLRLFSGVLNQRIDEIELYRVKDMTMERPLWLRMFGLSTLSLLTSDRSHPKVQICAITEATDLRETLRKQVEFWRDKKRVREVDFEEGGDLEGGDDFPM